MLAVEISIATGRQAVQLAGARRRDDDDRPDVCEPWLRSRSADDKLPRRAVRQRLEYGRAATSPPRAQQLRRRDQPYRHALILSVFFTLHDGLRMVL